MWALPGGWRFARRCSAPASRQQAAGARAAPSARPQAPARRRPLPPSGTCQPVCCTTCWRARASCPGCCTSTTATCRRRSRAAGRTTSPCSSTCSTPSRWEGLGLGLRPRGRSCRPAGCGSSSSSQPPSGPKCLEDGTPSICPLPPVPCSAHAAPHAACGSRCCSAPPTRHHPGSTHPVPIHAAAPTPPPHAATGGVLHLPRHRGQQQRDAAGGAGAGRDVARHRAGRPGSFQGGARQGQGGALPGGAGGAAGALRALARRGRCCS
jgi:hypothetical protein